MEQADGWIPGTPAFAGAGKPRDDNGGGDKFFGLMM
jgi:hypothetical protein